MARAKKERTPKSAENLKTMRTNEGLSQEDFAQAVIERNGLAEATKKEKANVSQQAISKYERNERPLEEAAAKRIIHAFSKYRLEWLMGKDGIMTKAQEARFANNVSQLTNAIRPGVLMDRGFRLLAEASGFSIETLEDVVTNGEIEGISSRLEEGMLVSLNELSARLTIDQLNKIENQVCDFAEFLLVKAIS